MAGCEVLNKSQETEGKKKIQSFNQRVTITCTDAFHRKTTVINNGKLLILKALNKRVFFKYNVC